MALLLLAFNAKSSLLGENEQDLKLDKDEESHIEARTLKAPFTGKCGDSVQYSYDYATKVLTIAGEGEMYDCLSPLGIVDSKVFDIKSVVIEIGVTSIGAYTFYNFGELLSITLPSSIYSIGIRAFFWLYLTYFHHNSGCSKENL